MCFLKSTAPPNNKRSILKRTWTKKNWKVPWEKTQRTMKQYAMRQISRNKNL